MSYRNTTTLNGPSASLQVCDATSGSVRMAWARPRPPEELTDDERVLLALKREEAVHDLFRRLFLLTTEQYLKNDLGKPHGMSLNAGRD